MALLSSFPAFCEYVCTGSALFYVAVSLAAFGLVLLIVIGVASFAYHRRRQRTVARLSKWQAQACHEWIKKTVDDSPAIPPAFLIRRSDLEKLEK